MLVTEIATNAAIKLRNFTIHGFTGVFKRFGLPHRYRKWLLPGLALWTVLQAACFFGYQWQTSGKRDLFYRNGIKLVQALTVKSAPAVLERDILSIDLAVKELAGIDGLLYGAILDHENTILAHTDIESPRDRMAIPDNNKVLKAVDGILVFAEVSAAASPVTGFLSDITFSDVEIGKAYVRMSETAVLEAVSRLRILYLFTGVLTTLVLITGGILLTREKPTLTVFSQNTVDMPHPIGPYHLQQRLAVGGMAELFVADYVREDGFRRKVAVKRILPHLAENTEFLNMFTREARLAAVLQHPNIVQIIDYGRIDNASFIAMEYINGRNLGEIITELGKGLPMAHAMFIVSETAKGIAYSHARCDDETGEPLNIVHRDVSPQNVLISFEGEVKLSDFGISKASSEPSLTQAGVIKGKLSYLSPEQAAGDPVDHQADIYALGLVFYEILTGQRVYRFKNDIEAIKTIETNRISPLKDILPNIPAELNRIVMKCLEKKKELRYPMASDLNADLMAFKRESKISFDTMDLSEFMKKIFQS
ncbi:MAG: serine/threonine protein kinase [Desulfobacteraceae bacterium]|nr:serine/threonine protein kinase [Desulfobacteraceae bacterium]